MRTRTLLLVAALAMLSGCQMLPWTSLDTVDPGVHRSAMTNHYKTGTAEDRFHGW